MSREQKTEEVKRRREGTSPWKRILGVDRKFTARVQRAKDRGQYTEPGQKSHD